MDLSAALQQAECEEGRPQGIGRLPAVPTGGTRLKRESRVNGPEGRYE